MRDKNKKKGENMKKILLICLLFTFVFAAQRTKVDIEFTPRVSTEHDVFPATNPFIEQIIQAKKSGDLATHQRLLEEYKVLAPGQPDGPPVYTGVVDPNDYPIMSFGPDVTIYAGDVYWNSWAQAIDLDDEAISVDYHQGDTIIAAVACADSLVRIFKSYDNGLTWNYLRWFSAGGNQNEPEVIWGPQGFYHVVIRTSSDNGNLIAWKVAGDESSADPVWVENSSDSVHNFSITTDKALWQSAYYIYLAYHKGVGGEGADEIWFTRSTDWGDSWAAPTALQYGGSGFPDLTFGGGDILYASYYAEVTSSDRRLNTRYSTDYGSTWASSITVQGDAYKKQGPQIAAAFDLSGDVWVVWPRKWISDPFDYDLFWSWSNDDGQNWSSPAYASAAMDYSEILPSLAIYGTNGSSAHYPWLSYTKVMYDLTGDPWVHMRAWDSGNDDFDSEETYADNATTLTRPIQTFDSDGETPAFAYVGFNGENVYFDSWSVGVEEEEGIAMNNGLVSTVSPNPFTHMTRIAYTLPSSGRVSATVYNALGQTVTKLVDGIQQSGKHELQWNATDLPKGVYFLKIETDNAEVTKKVILE